LPTLATTEGGGSTWLTTVALGNRLAGNSSTLITIPSLPPMNTGSPNAVIPKARSLQDKNVATSSSQLAGYTDNEPALDHHPHVRKRFNPPRALSTGRSHSSPPCSRQIPSTIRPAGKAPTNGGFPAREACCAESSKVVRSPYRRTLHAVIVTGCLHVAARVTRGPSGPTNSSVISES